MSAPKAGATPSDQARKDASASAHQSKADWEAVQKKSFARWCNTYLSARSEKIEDLGTDFKDGLRLIHLVEELSGVPLGRHNKAPKLDMQRMENIDLALKFLTKHERVTLVNIGAEDIHRANLKIILGLVWTLIIKYQIARAAAVAAAGDSKNNNESSALGALIAFVNAQIKPYGLGPINNLTSSFADGKVLSALTDSLERGYIDMKNLGEPLVAATHAIGVAEKYHQIPRILDPEDLISNPDQHSMMAYISYFQERALSYRKNRAYAALCTGSGPGWEGGVDNAANIFMIHTRTLTGDVGKGGESDRILVRLTKGKSDGKESKGESKAGDVIEADVMDQGDGSYTVGYAQLEAGEYTITVTIYNEPMKDTPRTIPIKAAPKEQAAVVSAAEPEPASSISSGATAESALAIETGSVVVQPGKPLQPAKLTVTSSSVVASGCVFQGFPITLGAGTILHPCVTLIAAGGPIIVGSNCIIEEYVVIENPIAADGKVQELVIGDFNMLEVGARVSARRIGTGNFVECKATLSEGVVIGNGCRVGAGVEVRAGERIADGTVVVGPTQMQRVKNAEIAVARAKEELKPRLLLLKTLLRPPAKS